MKDALPWMKNGLSEFHKQETLTTMLEIWMDRDTGVNYLYRRNGYSGGMTVLVDRDGKPLIGQTNE